MSEPDGIPAPAPPVPPVPTTQGQSGPWPAPPQPPAFAAPWGSAPPPQGYGPWNPPTAHAAVYPQAHSRAPFPRPRGPRGLGMVAFVLALAAAVIAPVLAAVAAHQIGLGIGTQNVSALTGADVDWSLLTPVREWVGMGEIAFWAGTALGTWAIVQGIIAIVTDRGRGWGIAAAVIAALGPILFGVALAIFLTTGLAASIGA